MKIPKTIKVGGHILEVILRDREKDDGHVGPASADFKFGKIWIDKTWVKSQQESGFFHEVIEAINWNWKLGLTESQIQGLEANLYQVLKDNNLLK